MKMIVQLSEFTHTAITPAAENCLDRSGLARGSSVNDPFLSEQVLSWTNGRCTIRCTLPSIPALRPKCLIAGDERARIAATLPCLSARSMGALIGQCFSLITRKRSFKQHFG